MSQSLISVITLTHNKLEVTRRCLPTLLHSTGVPWELLVVDNGSTDGTGEWLDAFQKEAARQRVGVTVIKNKGNIGCSTARNQATAQARGATLVYMDNDIALRSKFWLKRMSDVLVADARRGMVGPKLVYPLPPYRIQCAGAAVAPTGRIQFRGRGEDRGDPQFNTPDEVQCLISACCMVKSSVIQECGGFDEAFNPVEFEDIDLCYRIRSRGYTIHYVPDVEMYHFESVTTGGTPSLPNTRLIVENGLLFKRRWRHMFENESGPSDKAARWRHLPRYRFSEVGELPVI
ncbi:MAG: glycosyltransferase family 2 protein [Candidatus Pacebacteria bacterium]|nr:glycosyltransferase family 2 protein [Candidatus Paceibacterota bacterium]